MVQRMLILVSRGVVILTWCLGLCKIILAALFQSAVLHFQSAVLRLPPGYNRFHQSSNDNDIATMLCHCSDGYGRCAHSATVPTSFLGIFLYYRN